MTPAEKILWKALRNSRLGGHKFRRQHPIGKFIADFYCHERNLVIEVDGDIHDNEDVRERDEGRTHELENFELRVSRFRNEEVMENLTSVLNQIRINLISKPTLSEREGKVLLLKEKDLG